MKKKYLSAVIVLALLGSIQAQAGVLVGGTRVIFDGKKREASISVKNEGTVPYVVQTWLDKGDDTVKADTPFVIVPPIFRLDPNKENLLRIMFSGQGVPEDRESVYWLNVQEIPPASELENTLQIAMRSRIKMFYRPKNIQGDPVKAATQLQWKIERDAATGASSLVARNDSAFHVNLVEAKLQSPAGNQEVAVSMVAPKTESRFPLKEAAAPSDAPRLTYKYINDYGGQSEPIVANGAISGNK
ncbi:fimbrial biogenesis chaperone [Collimonas silvisoli]|uniref:fimbrial biogenesis chaperone n=1 Tax=Collimonas silvisoli TaxID=2825884 RepID=UPI001B8B7F96|nr:molecular chaperone [Collimonas silvisoli]